MNGDHQYFFVHKLDISLQFYIDYKMFNKATACNSYPLPKHEDLFNRLGLACFFSSLDLRSGYWQVHIADCIAYKTIF